MLWDWGHLFLEWHMTYQCVCVFPTITIEKKHTTFWVFCGEILWDALHLLCRELSVATRRYACSILFRRASILSYFVASCVQCDSILAGPFQRFVIKQAQRRAAADRSRHESHGRIQYQGTYFLT